VAYPSIPYSLVSEDALVLEVQLDAPGTVYYVATTTGYGGVVTNITTGARRTTPTPEEVRARGAAGAGAAGVGTPGEAGAWGDGALTAGAFVVASAAAVASANVTDLTYIGAVDLWVVAASTSGALQLYVSLLTANTRDVTPPEFLMVRTPSVGGVL
jgi:hypothetical protein